jgi:predicted GH43/DUF377 family glycosyl hydrolase
MKLTALATALVLATGFADPGMIPFGPWQRVSEQPLLGPRGSGFESAGVFNPAVTKLGEQTVMLYRAQDAKGVSRLGYAVSADGIHFDRQLQPAFSPEAPYESAGVEDPRLISTGDAFYLTYTAYNGTDAQLCLARSTAGLRDWKRLGVIMPANKGRWNVHWTKSGAILPQKVNGHYWMYFMGDAAGQGANQMGVAYSDDLVHWTEPLDHPILEHRRGMFDSKVVEPGPPPILTSRGVLLIYNGADDRLAYRTGWALFDKSDPARVVARSEAPVFSPERGWEESGQVPNVVFIEGLIREGNKLVLYYGGADKYVGAVSTQLLLK